MNLKTVHGFLNKNSGWSLSPNGKIIFKKYRFAEFKAALKFVQRVGGLADKMDHHPDMALTQYRFVTLRLTTRSKGGVTQKDLALAQGIDKLYAG